MIQHQYKTLLVGTSEFAAEVFLHLLKQNYLVVKGLVTQPDKYIGRKHQLDSPPAKKAFIDKGIHIFQPIKFREKYKEILDIVNPDLIIVCAYGKILPKEFIEFPKYKSLNIHASLLPELRGATPVQSAILKNFDRTGITIQVMNEGMDEGDIVSSKSIGLDKDITTPELFQRLIPLIIKLLDETLPEYLQGGIIPVPQVGNISYCYVADFSYEKGQIDWKLGVEEISAKVRAFNPEPGAWVDGLRVYKTTENIIDKKLKIHSVEVYTQEVGGNYKVGDVVVIDRLR